MLKARLIPCLDVKDGRVVKGVNFVDLRDAGDPVEAAKAYDAAGADELCFLDITATHENRGIIFDVVQRTAEACFMPLTVGGGVRSARRHPQAAAGRRRQGVDQFGRRGRPRLRARRPRRNSAASASSWRSTPRQWRPADGRSSPMAAASRPASTRSTSPAKWWRCGAGEILLTSMDRDGTGQGFDLALTRAIADAVSSAGDRLGRRRHARSSGRRHPRWPCHGRARRLDLPFRNLYHRRGQAASWRPVASRCGCD